MKIILTKWMQAVARTLVGGIFIYAGVIKILDPWSFADSVAAFKVLPIFLVTPVALSLPVMEGLLGLGLLTGMRQRACAATVFILCVLFAGLLVQASLRGLEVDCGCFGKGAASTAKTVEAILRDLVLAAVAGWLFRQSK